MNFECEFNKMLDEWKNKVSSEDGVEGKINTKSESIFEMSVNFLQAVINKKITSENFPSEDYFMSQIQVNLYSMERIIEEEKSK